MAWIAARMSDSLMRRSSQRTRAPRGVVDVHRRYAGLVGVHSLSQMHAQVMPSRISAASRSCSPMA
jgi:hypothetical protein